MKAISKIIEISNSKEITTEYIESELEKQGINTLRWAIVSVKNNLLYLSVTALAK